MAAGFPSLWGPLSPDPRLWAACLAWRLRAAESGSVAASIQNLVSGRVARGSSGYTIPGLSPWASPASLKGLVGVGLLRSRRGEAKSRAVDSCRGGCQILPGVFLYCICIKSTNVVGTGLSLVGP